MKSTCRTRALARLFALGCLLPSPAMAAGLTVLIYAPDGSVVTVDGVSYGTGPMKIENLPPGAHTLEVVPPGGARVQRAVIQQDVWDVEKRIDIRLSASGEGETSTVEGPGPGIASTAVRVQPYRPGRTAGSPGARTSQRLGQPYLTRLPDGTEALVYPVQRNGR